MQCIELDTSGNKIDNITNWALEQFDVKYNAGKTSKLPITKDAIFHYVYGVLHDPIYREKYALNLKREFPRIPFYADFWRWVEWGEKLMSSATARRWNGFSTSTRKRRRRT